MPSLLPSLPPPGPLLSLALLQSAGRPGEPEANLAALDEAAGRAARGGARLLVSSELFLSGYAVGEDAVPGLAVTEAEAARRLGPVARRHGIAVACGYPEKAGAALYNSVLLLGPDGAKLAGYRKTHLYGPFEHAVFTPGEQSVVQAELDGFRLGLMVCYDVEFPENVRAHARAGTDLLLVPTAQMHPYEFVARSVVPVRAFESQLYIAYVNRVGREGEFDFVGLSCLAAPDGTDLLRGGPGEELLLGSVDLAALADSRTRNPYLHDLRTGLHAGPAAP